MTNYKTEEDATRAFYESMFKRYDGRRTREDARDYDWFCAFDIESCIEGDARVFVVRWYGHRDCNNKHKFDEHQRAFPYTPEGLRECLEFRASDEYAELTREYREAWEVCRRAVCVG